MARNVVVGSGQQRYTMTQIQQTKAKTTVEPTSIRYIIRTSVQLQVFNVTSEEADKTLHETSSGENR